MTYTQPSLFDAVSEQPAKKPATCHFRGCAEPVVGSSTVKRDGYVCKCHNDIEWATALSRGNDGYWRKFGQCWLDEMEGREPMSNILTRAALDTLLLANGCATSEFQHKKIHTKQGETYGYVVSTVYAGKPIRLGRWDELNQHGPAHVLELIVKKISDEKRKAVSA